MDIVVKGRHCEVSAGFREHVEEKLARLEKHDDRLIRMEVKVEKGVSSKPDCAVRVELTALSRGPVVRAEACAEDKMAALDLALDKMASQMRRANDRRKVHRGQHSPAALRDALVEEVPADLAAGAGDDGAVPPTTGPVRVEGDGPLVVREKTFPAVPVTVEQALYEMELVGHDFYLFVDAGTGAPSAVYRRRGYDYGVIALDLEASEVPLRVAEG
ncbi:ribosomal subunit interface protein [Marmoricola endophyticus]|uniref:Ribosome hibernation promoting factor n=1 Tax=Marmoricola endophyticus TaxID=2040280 RepID=A0A917BVS0_9ACTN|nr:ribosome-associated translation inhibitor RaiA [Marmoricola endophyticus]GGF56511.1 ribosomal subunit interface protein [Marmoricola endophyticus]